MVISAPLKNNIFWNENCTLKQTITTHLEETKNQVSRLESVFASVGENAAAKKCLAMEGLLIEATESFSMTYGLL